MSNQLWSQQHYFSPGRVNLIGEHLDYNGGNVLPIAINYGTEGEVILRNDGMIELCSNNFLDDGTMLVNPKEKIKKTGKWFDYALGVIAVFKKKGYAMTQGFSLTIHGHIPNRSGLSSSASLEVLIAFVLNDLNQLGLSRVELALLAQQAENTFVGVSCGIMDQFIIANAKQHHALCLNCEELSYEQIPCDFVDEGGEAFQLIVLASNVKRELVTSAYNERRQECEAAYKIAQQRYGVASLAAVTMPQMEQLQQQLTSTVFQRLRHVVSEQRRVTESVDALRLHKMSWFGELMYHSHASLAQDFQVSCSELDFIVNAAKQLGAIGARMTGAGFGGCAIALVPKQQSVPFCEKITATYHENCGLPLDCYLVSAADGVCQRMGASVTES